MGVAIIIDLSPLLARKNECYRIILELEFFYEWVSYEDVATEYTQILLVGISRLKFG